LVRQRSRVQIPAKALLFCKKGEGLGFLRSNKTLPNSVRFLPNSVRPRQRSTRLSYRLAPIDDECQNRPSVSTINEEFWTEFEEYLLKNHNKQTTKDRVFYSKKYYHILTSHVNAQELLLLSDQKRMDVMKALATLSKYLGCYDKWKNIKERHQLKWSNGDSLETFSMFINTDQNYSSMIEWLKNCCSKLSSSYRNILLFNTLTGLRPEEACKAIQIIHKQEDTYVRKDLMILEHYKFPDIFIRRTKKAYISILTDSILELAKQASNCGYNALRLAVKRKKLDMNMSYCRKIFATYLRTQGIEQETIDLLQGRAPKSVFARHYFRPNFSYDRIRIVVKSLYDSILA
jgi:intergrase/recombinase